MLIFTGKAEGSSDKCQRPAFDTSNLNEHERKAVTYAGHLDRIAFQVINKNAAARQVDAEDGNRLYRNQVNVYNVLTTEQERAVTYVMVHHPSPELREKARDLVMKCNQKMVLGCAHAWHAPHRTKGLSLYDLIQQGQIGLMEACAQFKPEKGFKFMTYAKGKVDMRMRRYIEEQSANEYGVQVPTAVYYEIKKVRKFMQSVADAEHREPDTEEIMAETGLDAAKVELAVQMIKNPPRSMQERLYSADSEDLSFGDTIESDEELEETAINEIVTDDLRARIDDAFASMSPTHQKAASGVLGWGEYEERPLSTARLAEELSITVGEARRLRKESEAALRQALIERGVSEEMLPSTL